MTQVHRFRGKVAVATTGGPTVYLTPVAARLLAAALQDCAFDIAVHPAFHESAFLPREVHDEQH